MSTNLSCDGDYISIVTFSHFPLRQTHIETVVVVGGRLRGWGGVGVPQGLQGLQAAKHLGSSMWPVLGGLGSLGSLVSVYVGGVLPDQRWPLLFIRL